MKLSYQTIGDPGDSPLIFFHGLGAGAKQITSSFPNLSATHLIAPDMPGHGGSQDFSLDELNFDSFADKVIALMDELGIESSNVGGLSMGSGITLNLALRYPERVKNIILLRPSWLDQKKPEHLKLVAFVGQWIEGFGIEAAREKLSEHSDFQKIDRENKLVANSIVGLFERPNTPASTAVLYKMWEDAPFSSVEQLASISQNSLVLSSPRDELHPQSTADVIVDKLPHVETFVLPPRYHEPEAYGRELNSCVTEFLAQ